MTGIGQHEANVRPIVVVSGLPRSGTSLMMQMLTAGGLPLLVDDVRTADASNPHGYFELAAVKQLPHNASFLSAAIGKGVKIIAPLLPYLPDRYRYQVIFLERDLHQVLASQQAMLARLGQPEDHPSPTLAGTMGQQLTAAMQLIAQHPTAESLRVAYQDCLDRPLEVAQQVASFVGIPSDKHTAMAAVVDVRPSGRQD